jgi:hypothetical protein
MELVETPVLQSGSAVNKSPQAKEAFLAQTIDVRAFRAFVNSDRFPDIQNLWIV